MPKGLSMNISSTACDHAGSVWKIHVVGLERLYEPGTWECTRCGDQWDEHPVIARIRSFT